LRAVNLPKNYWTPPRAARAVAAIERDPSEAPIRQARRTAAAIDFTFLHGYMTHVWLNGGG
jgi:hypothetical protein